MSEPWSRSWLAEPDRIAKIMEAAKDPANGLDDETLSGIADQAEPWETWAMRVFPHLRADVAPWFHRGDAQHVWETAARYTPPPVAPVLFRGGAKSTLSRALALGLGLTGKRKFVLVVCATQDAANRAVTDMGALITEDVVDLYPWAASRTVASKLLVQFGVRQSVINVGGRLTVLGVGLTGGTRGLLVNNQRPDAMLLDDLDDTGDSSAVIRRKRASLGVGDTRGRGWWRDDHVRAERDPSRWDHGRSDAAGTRRGFTWRPDYRAGADARKPDIRRRGASIWRYTYLACTVHARINQPRTRHDDAERVATGVPTRHERSGRRRATRSAPSVHHHTDAAYR